MNILIDIGHPAHVHYYRNFAKELLNKGHKVSWSVKDIPMAKRLLDIYGHSYTVLPKKKDSLFGKFIRQLQYNWLVWLICRREKIDIAIGTSVSVAQISKFTSIKSFVFDDDDDEAQPLVTKYVNPFADTLLSPEALKGKRKRRDTVFYAGYHEMAYLHPIRFQPNPSVLKDIGIREGEKYFIMRFNAFKAHHDLGISGLNLQQKLQLIDELKPHGKIFITTERDIEPDLRKFQLKISPEKIHSIMAFSTLFLGDSQTMTSEAAVMGIPSLRCNSFAGRLSNLEELEHRYGLTFGYLPEEFDKMLMKLRELIAIPNLKENWQEKLKKLLSEKIDVTAFWTWFIENYPESKRIMKENPEYQYRFR
jgi:uncharacterized protein